MRHVATQQPVIQMKRPDRIGSGRICSGRIGRTAFSVAAFCLPIFCVAIISPLAIAEDFDKAPISYRKAAATNRISRLQEQLDNGTLALQHDQEHGYLKSLLNALEVPEESQMLVFSKTSLQLRRITPRTPRAIYFNDDVYVGFCQRGDVLEVSASDPNLGTVFYTLDQEEAAKPAFQRNNDNCLVCHSSSRTGGVPGHVIRSLYADAGGQPIFSAGSRMVDHTTPLKQRWGGWYVTGTHGDQNHLGNLVIKGRRVLEPVDNTQGENVQQLDDRFKVDRYLTPHSDIVALMVLEHQALVHNRITKANFAARQAAYDETTMNKILGNDKNHRLESTGRRIASAAEDLVEAMLLVDEAALTAPVTGTSGYAEMFAAVGPRDSKGRSLRDLDMTSRMFRYPCSFLVYSEAFDALPDESRAVVWKKMWDVLSGENESEDYAHLSADDRRAIAQILDETKSDLPDYWKVDPIAKLSATSP